MVSVLLTRSRVPAANTLLLVDECGQLGSFDLLKTLFTLCRGFGIQPWFFFQSLSQLKDNYEKGWNIFLENAGVVQFFGFANMLGCNEWSKFFNRKPKDLLALPKEDQLLYISGRGTLEARRLDYLSDENYAGMFDPNPYFANCFRGSR